MTTPTGTIGLSDVNVELGKSSTAQISLNDSDVRSLAGIPSGTISMNDLRGKSATLGYAEDVFSTSVYTGNGSTQTITNGIDLANKNGMVWIKNRTRSSDHNLYDTARGTIKALVSNSTSGTQTQGGSLTSFAANGFTLGSLDAVNRNADSFVSWTFRKAEKFFDIVTYTGTGNTSTRINHSLNAQPGMIIIKRLDTTSNWNVWHIGTGITTGRSGLSLNSSTNANIASMELNFTNLHTSTFFGPDYVYDHVSAGANIAGAQYVAYIFASGSGGGYGDSGSESIIKCGLLTGPTAIVELGWEPQFYLLKKVSASDGWWLMDNQRGWYNKEFSSDPYLSAELDYAEAAANFGHPLATGFNGGGQGGTFIYMAIRRPHKPPTTGTQVFVPLAYTPSTGTTRTTGFPVDLSFIKTTTLNFNGLVTDRLRGFAKDTSSYPPTLFFSSTAEESGFNQPAAYGHTHTGYQDGQALGNYFAVSLNFKRAPKFFDIVCYTGNGSTQNVTHNLKVVPELILVKVRSTTSSWAVYAAPVGNTKYLVLNSTGNASSALNMWNNTTPTSSVFTVNGTGTFNNVNGSGQTYVAYLFASLAGISKIGSYTGNGSSQTINMGFSSGARFFLVKNINSSGGWFSFDTARGIVSGDDFALELNSTAAEQTSYDAVDPTSSGIIVNQTGLDINVNGQTYLYFAIA